MARQPTHNPRKLRVVRVRLSQVERVNAWDESMAGIERELRQWELARVEGQIAQIERTAQSVARTITSEVRGRIFTADKHPFEGATKPRSVPATGAVEPCDRRPRQKVSGESKGEAVRRFGPGPAKPATSCPAPTDSLPLGAATGGAA